MLGYNPKLPTFSPEDILSGQIPHVDFHVHTSYTDGIDTVYECVFAAQKMGLSAIGFSEHVSPNQVWLAGWYPAYLKDIQASRKAFSDIKILTGVEAKVLNYHGRLNASPDLLDASDLVIGVVHTYPKNDLIGSRNFKELSQETCRQIELQASLSVLENPKVSVIGHVGAVYSKHFGPLPLEDYDHIIKKAAEKCVAFEINSKYHRTIAKELLVLCVKHDAKVSLGSDAHSKTEVGEIVIFLEEELNK
jgi:putative hydrolase